jgi:flagellar biosynthetic protein FliO
MTRIARYLTHLIVCLMLAGGIAAGAAAPQNKSSNPTEIPANLPIPSQPAQGLSQPEAMGAPDSGFPVLRTIGGFGLVLTLIIAAYWGLRKFAPQYFAKSASGKTMKVIETLPMGDRRSISLIEVANSRFLVGNTPHQINLILTLPEPVSVLSAPEALPSNPKPVSQKESNAQFRKLYEVERGRSIQRSANPLPEDLRLKMRQLREALER